MVFIFIFFIDGTDEIVLIDMRNVINEAHLTRLFDVSVGACKQIFSCLETAVLTNVKEAYNIKT